jgi:hypothetical protein
MDMTTTELKEMKFQKDSGFVANYVTSNILECMNFYNRELGGKYAHEKNLSGEWGSKELNELAKKMVREDFILHLMLKDCEIFCNSKLAKESGIKFECGRTRSHVWVHINGERVLMFHF